MTIGLLKTKVFDNQVFNLLEQ